MVGTGREKRNKYVGRGAVSQGEDKTREENEGLRTVKVDRRWLGERRVGEQAHLTSYLCLRAR
jgi:hypothetical protein